MVLSQQTEYRTINGRCKLLFKRHFSTGIYIQILATLAALLNEPT